MVAMVHDENVRMIFGSHQRRICVETPTGIADLCREGLFRRRVRVVDDKRIYALTGESSFHAESNKGRLTVVPFKPRCGRPFIGCASWTHKSRRLGEKGFMLC